jgi:hypothetical protein
MDKRWLTMRTESLPPLTTGGMRVTLHVRVVRLSVPGRVALIWARPGPVEVVTAAGERRWLAVRDVTREVLWGLAALCAAAGIWRLSARRTAH